MGSEYSVRTLHSEPVNATLPNHVTMWRVFVFLMTIVFRCLCTLCKPRQELVFENLALRQQVTALKQERPKPRLHETDRAFWVALGRTLPSWRRWLVIVKPETVVNWNRRRFRRFWTTIDTG